MIRTNQSNRVITATILMLAFLVGCGSKKPPNPYQVSKASGRVSYNGKPLDKAYITFFPQEAGEAASAISDSSGNFVLSTYERLDGATIGPHIAIVTVHSDAPVLPGDEAALRKASPIPAKYMKPETSGLKFDVKGDGNNVFDIKLTDEDAKK